ncbi:MAG TPA: D-alanyl-D-alanine carboxypeptidase/D-alanyl-D-alanine-endopeptidase [Solirubrobacteraceae bacterium]|nr:D-alanyl-D-alanine carboxypeptidase/D-alanyl-D-alanine-endopeptidase [Solirubrobacteraceae bacterium]
MPRKVDISLFRLLNETHRSAAPTKLVARARGYVGVRLAPVLALAALVAPGTLAAPAAAVAAPGTLAGLQSDLARQMKLAGSHSSAYVYDLTSKQALFSERATVKRPPASVEKLYTATTALERLGPTARLTTTVLGTGKLGPDGVWEGDLYLHGGGDPTLGTSAFIASHYGGVGTSVSTLVSQLVDVDGIHSVTGRVEGDESYFDSLRGEPSSGYAPDPFLEGTLSALAFNRGASGSYRGRHAPAAYAAHELLVALKAAGVAVARGSGAASAPAGAARLALAPSPTVTQLLGLTLPPSDNFFAETLLKDLGARFGGAGTTAAGARVVRETLAGLGLHPRVVDGSGLSREDQTSPLQVVTLLSDLAPTTLGTTLREDMAVAGHSGTLAERMRGTAAAGRCQGKTGTLTGVSNLVGYCQDAAGQYLAFAFFNDGIAIEAAHVLQDNMTISLADY